MAFKVKHANASIAFCEGEVELEKFKEVIDELPYVKAIVCWAFDAGVKSLKRSDGTKTAVMTFAQLLEAGDKVSDSDLEARISMMKPTHCCSLIYTSGTTGNPKVRELSLHCLSCCCCRVVAHIKASA
jgi:long-chain-fatty-acid--CoA ligase ACSBG